MRASSLLLLAVGAVCSAAVTPFNNYRDVDRLDREERLGLGRYHGGDCYGRHGRRGYHGGCGGCGQGSDFGFGRERYGYEYDDDDINGDYEFRDYGRCGCDADIYDDDDEDYDYDYDCGYGGDIRRYSDHGSRYSDRRGRDGSDVTSCRSCDLDELRKHHGAECEKDEECCFEKGFRFNRGVKYDKAFGFRRDRDTKFDLDGHSRSADARYHANGYFDEEDGAKAETEDEYFDRISFYDPGRYREFDYY